MEWRAGYRASPDALTPRESLLLPLCVALVSYDIIWLTEIMVD